MAHVITHEIKQIKDLRIVGHLIQTTMTAVMSNNPIPAFWGELISDGRYEKLMATPSDCPCTYGACLMHTEEDMDYTVGVALPEGAAVPEGLHLVEMPAGEYMAVEVELKNLHAGFGYANEWMEKEGYTWAHGGSFELYPDTGMDKPTDLHLYIPIMRK